MQWALCFIALCKDTGFDNTLTVSKKNKVQSTTSAGYSLLARVIKKSMSTTPSKKITTEYQLSPGNFDVVDGSTRTSATVRSTMRGSIMDIKIIRHDGTSICTEHTFEELETIENERRKILKRVELPAWRIILYKSGTCINGLLLDPLIHITMWIYIGIRVYARLADEAAQGFEFLEKSNIGVLGGFLSFFLVLFVNQANTRFLEMYGFSKAASGRTQDVAGMASTMLPPHLAEQLIRHMNAAQIAGYVGLGHVYSETHFFDHYNREWNLLTDREMMQLLPFDMDNGSDVLKELCTWCQRDVGVAKKLGHIDSMEACELHTRIVAFRAAMDGIYDYCDQPPHFFYIHFLCLLSAFYLPIFAIDQAYRSGWGANSSIGIEFLNGIIVLLQCVFCVGLRLLGQKMVDPYGDDLEDLSVKTYVETTLHICNIIFTTTGSYMNDQISKAATETRQDNSASGIQNDEVSYNCNNEVKGIFSKTPSIRWRK